MDSIKFGAICKALKTINLPVCDLVIGIASGGVVPASLVACKLGCQLKIIELNYRDDNNLPRHLEPILLSEIVLPSDIKSILLVDDVSISGKTLESARQLFKDYQVWTMVFRGKADYVLFPNINTCLKWPWKA